MAKLNVIDYSAFVNCAPATNHRALIHNSRAMDCHANDNLIREPNPDYGSTADKESQANDNYAALSQPLWPQFPEGAYLNAEQAGRFYRAALGVVGLAHILSRSASLRGIAQDIDGEPDRSLKEPHESHLWCALSELGNTLANLADDLLSKSCEQEREYKK